MSYSYLFNPMVDNPRMSRHIPQVASFKNQEPFFFGGSQVPNVLFLGKTDYNGSGFHKGSSSITHLGDRDFTTKKGDMVYHRKGHNIKIPAKLPFMK